MDKMKNAGKSELSDKAGLSGLSKEKLVGMYETLVRIRRFEEEATYRIKQGVMPGFIHVYLGEEAMATGACATLRPEDYMTSTHRGHGHLIARGAQTDRMFAELYGREGGYCKGRGGSMHIADFHLNILGANGVVAAGMPIAVGAALGVKMKKEDRVVLCFFGDAATNQGAFHEAVNLAATWCVPVVFVCENNFFGISVPQREHQNIRDISIRARGYDIPGVTVDGNDVLAVFEATQAAVDRARAGKGPSLVVGDTWRYEGHFVGDPKAYRTREEEEEWKKKDPIPRFRSLLIGKGVMGEDEAVAVEKSIEKEIEDAVKFAEASPHCKGEDALKYVYYVPGEE
jgi:acetoin:2,6-dichlorophenolindophenol oxidoreductase subunit alpha